MDPEQIVLITLFISLILTAIFAKTFLVLSFKKDNRICCISGGILFAFSVIVLGILNWIIFTVMSVNEFVVTTAFLYLLCAIGLSLFILFAVKKKREFCCLGGGIGLAGIGIGVGILFALLDALQSEELTFVVFILLITTVLILAFAFINILVSLKKCSGLCCLGSIIAATGAVTGMTIIGGFIGNDFDFGLVTGAIGFLTIILLLSILAFLATKNTKLNHHKDDCKDHRC